MFRSRLGERMLVYYVYTSVSGPALITTQLGNWSYEQEYKGGQVWKVEISNREEWLFLRKLKDDSDIAGYSKVKRG